MALARKINLAIARSLRAKKGLIVFSCFVVATASPSYRLLQLRLSTTTKRHATTTTKHGNYIRNGTSSGDKYRIMPLFRGQQRNYSKHNSSAGSDSDNGSGTRASSAHRWITTSSCGRRFANLTQDTIGRAKEPGFSIFRFLDGTSPALLRLNVVLFCYRNSFTKLPTTLTAFEQSVAS